MSPAVNQSQWTDAYQKALDQKSKRLQAALELVKPDIQPAVAAEQQELVAATMRPTQVSLAQVRMQQEALLSLPAHDNEEVVKLQLEQAIELEHATIPLYLCALHSIKEGQNVEASEIIGGVVGEEMLHMALACNLLNGIGGQPRLDDPAFIPKYPGSLPANIHAGHEFHLRKCSIEQLKEFMLLEIPESAEEAHGAPQGSMVHQMLQERASMASVPQKTIGMFYANLKKTLTNIVHGGNNIFDKHHNQVGPQSWGKHGYLYTVTDLDSACKAIDEIVVQGEGAVWGGGDHNQPTNPEDGYGDVAHYYRFEEIVQGRKLVQGKDGKWSFTGEKVPLDPEGIWPMQDDPSTASLPHGTSQYRLSSQFDSIYSNLLRGLNEVFNGHPDRLNAAIGTMFSLRVHSKGLMQLPTIDDPLITVGPAFQYAPPS